MSFPAPRSLPLPLAGAAILLAVPALLAACNEASQPPAASAAGASGAPPRPVLVSQVRYGPRHAERSFVGTVKARVETDLGFRVGGKVVRRLVEVGQSVKAGDPLAELDETDLRLQVEQAEADIRALVTAVSQADADEQRVSSLRKQGWSTDSTLDRQRAESDLTRSRKDKAERALSLARNALDYAILRADADGVVTATSVEPGQVVAAGQPAIRLARAGDREALVAIPESLVTQVQARDASASLWSAPGRPLLAILREVSPVADPATRTFAARFSLPGADASLRLGMTVTVTLADPGHEAVARLPLSALFNQGSGPAVWTVSPQTGALALRRVDVAAYEARDVLVSGGVGEGDEVVALGVQKLDEGQKVHVVSSLGL